MVGKFKLNHFSRQIKSVTIENKDEKSLAELFDTKPSRTNLQTITLDHAYQGK